jgi:hypothetical protein
MPQWVNAEKYGFGVHCKDHQVRVLRPTRKENINGRGYAEIPRGGVGYCYAAPGGAIHVGFTRSFTGTQKMSPTQYDYCVTFWYDEQGALEILA